MLVFNASRRFTKANGNQFGDMRKSLLAEFARTPSCLNITAIKLFDCN